MTGIRDRSLQQGTIHLKNGRQLGYAEYGDPAGFPLFLFHGIPGSRLMRGPDEELTAACGVRLIVPERPGMGLSDFQAGRRILDWPRDVAELADQLGIARFAVMGISGGGPYTAACGYAMPERIVRLGLVSGVGPIGVPGALQGMISSNRMGYSVGRWIPWELWRRIFELYYGSVSRHPEQLARVTEEEPDSDRAVFSRPGVRELFIETFRESFRQGTMGPARDGWLLSRSWGFPLRGIRVPAFLWQGEQDVVVTPAMGRYQASWIPGCQAVFYPGEGHLVFISHWAEILRTLTGNLSCGE